MFSRFIHTGAHQGFTLFHDRVVFRVGTGHILSLHSSADGLLGYFHLLVIVNIAAVAVGV